MTQNKLLKEFNSGVGYLANSKAKENNPMLNTHKLPIVMAADDFNYSIKKIKPIKPIRNKK
jgi:hypothetical protein